MGMLIIVFLFLTFVFFITPQIISYRSYSNYKEFYKNIDTLKHRHSGQCLDSEYKVWGKPIYWKVEGVSGYAYYHADAGEVSLFKSEFKVSAVNAFGNFAPLTNKWHNKVLKAIEEKGV